jgi:hypothetical protein
VLLSDLGLSYDIDYPLCPSLGAHYIALDEYRKANLKLWNNWAEINAASEMYNVEAFKKGKSSLNSLELGEVGDVAGKSLLHLQCHFSKDTLTWARMGAIATGDRHRRSLPIHSSPIARPRNQRYAIGGHYLKRPQARWAKSPV